MEHPISVRSAGGDAGVDFSLNVSGYLQQFRVSLEALEDHFGLPIDHDEEAQVRAFHDGAQRICAVAKKKPHVPGNNRVVLVSDDF
ncbi:DUF1488 family protein [Cupriavidus sp.]|uniref:DUF1488 family protein n=1 Tax=Cupriavidus sp. TaxID=1873897 RepID=UPI003D11F105